MRRLAECEQSGFNGQANTAWPGSKAGLDRGDRSQIVKRIVRLPIDPLNPHFSDKARNEMKSGISEELLVSVLQTQLITNVSL